MFSSISCNISFKAPSFSNMPECETLLFDFSGVSENGLELPTQKYMRRLVKLFMKAGGHFTLIISIK